MAEKKHFNRRDFLKVVGVGTGIAATGCGRQLPEKLIPYVIQPDEVIPGVATWYSGTCRECRAGCGTLVRTREGRAVKIEGNPKHPINKGGLCANGQSALQSLYDPDRLREPQLRDAGGDFKAVSWIDAVDGFAQNLADLKTKGKEGVFVTPPLSGSEASLVAEFVKRVPGLTHLEYELIGHDAVDQAAEDVFGEGVRTLFDFSKADYILSFGADFMESWLSPVEFSRGWAEGRKFSEGRRLNKLVHVEPRLSLTAGNADRWIMNHPDSEGQILLALLKAVIANTGGKNISSAHLAQMEALIADYQLESGLHSTGFTKGMINTLASELLESPTSLVVAGGAAVSGERGVFAAALANLLNIALGNVGKTLLLVKTKTPRSKNSYAKLCELLSAVADKKRNVGLLIVSGVNPAYTLPLKARYREAVTNIPMVVSVATHLDETASLANLILPLSTTLESWSDAEPRPGVYNLNQPAMQPLYKTQSLGDTLIATLNSKALKSPIEKVSSYYDYLQVQWKQRTGEPNFDSRWIEFVERGGEWPSAVENKAGEIAISLDRSALVEPTVLATAKPKPLSVPKARKVKPEELTFMAYPSVNSFDGNTANRPWMQELPNPMTTVVWGSWVEMHPSVAERFGFVEGDVIQVISQYGAVEAPLYLNKYIHPNLLAMPIGQGHEALGRFAVGVGANPLSILPPEPDGGQMRFSVSDIKLRKSIAKEKLVKLSGSDTQLKSGIARSVAIADLLHGKEEKDHAQNGHHGGHHDRLALGPRPEPKQMYRQMEHPLYKWGMSIDLSSCTGCSACVVACYAENNVPVVGKTLCYESREMSWIHIERYFDGPETQPVSGFVPMMCQHCNNAPCEPVCPVYATYHTEDGLNSMVYNRCVGTRYCSNNCSYKVRRFNWFRYSFPEPMNWQLNPDVTVREVGVMEKCSYCIQRIREVQNNAKDDGRMVKDGEIEPACASSCPTKAIKFGNLLDPSSQVSVEHRDPRSYKILDFELNTQPSTSYLARVKNEPSGSHS